MRSLPFPLPNGLLPRLAAALAAFGMGAALLWAMSHLEGKWLGAVLVGLCLPWIAVLIRDLESFFLGLFVFLLPIRVDVHLHYEKIAAGAGGFSLSAGDLALLGLYAVWITRLLTSPPQARRIRLMPALSLPFGVFILWGGFSALQATDPVLSFYTLFRIIKSYLAFFYLMNNVRRDSQLIGIGLTLCAGMLFEGALAFAQYHFGTFFELKVLGETRHSFVVHETGTEELARVGGTLGHPNGLGAYVGSMLPIAAALIWGKKSRVLSLAAVFMFVVGLITLILTFSRGSWLSTAIALGFVVFLGTWKRFGILKAVQRLVTLALIVAACAAPFADPIARRLFEDDHGRALSRVPLMQVAWNIIRQNPLLGVGLNNYNLVMGEYDNTFERITFHVQNPVHNSYLYIAAEAGIPALLSFLWLIANILRIAWRNFCEVEGLPSLMSLGIMGGLVSFLTHNLFSFSQFGSTYYFAFFIGVVGAISCWNTSQEGPPATAAASLALENGGVRS